MPIDIRMASLIPCSYAMLRWMGADRGKGLTESYHGISVARADRLSITLPIPVDRTLAVACLLLVLVMGAVELTLIEVKYTVFRGGFLQAYQLVTPGERASFAGMVLLLDGVLAVTAASLWLVLGARRPRVAVLFAFDFLVLAGGMAVVVLIARYQVLRYFSDTVSFELIRRLGGGSLTDALLFVSSEITLFVLALAGCAVAYLLFRRLLRHLLPRSALLPGPPASPAPWLRCALLLTVLAACLLLIVGRIPGQRAALERSLGYGLVNNLLAQVTDLDRDGHGPYTRLGDSHPFDASRYPLALDVPGNGVDEDGYGGDLAPLTTAERARLTPSRDWTFAGLRPHLVLVVLESTRADVLAVELNGQPVAPNLRALAARGTAAGVYAHEAFTVAALKAIMNGHHGVADPSASLFTILRRNGYRIAVFSGQDESFGDIAADTDMECCGTTVVDARALLAERAHPFAAQGSLRIDGRIVLQHLERVLLRESWDEPHFLYVNLQEPHFPYHHEGMPQLLSGTPIPRREISAANRAWVQATYLNAVANADARLGELLALLDRKGVLERSLLVVVGDHGESLFDDGTLGHGHALNDAQTRALLVLSRPGLRLPPVLGQEMLKDIVLSAMGAERTDGPDPRRLEPYPVFQIIGSLERPSQIAQVEPDGTRLVLDVERRQILPSTSERWLPCDGLAPDDPRRQQIARLVREWELRRWLAAGSPSATSLKDGERD